MKFTILILLTVFAARAPAFGRNISEPEPACSAELAFEIGEEITQLLGDILGETDPLLRRIPARREAAEWGKIYHLLEQLLDRVEPGERSRSFFRIRYGLTGDPPQSFREIARSTRPRVTYQHVQRVTSRILRRLREPARLRDLREGLCTVLDGQCAGLARYFAEGPVERLTLSKNAFRVLAALHVETLTDLSYYREEDLRATKFCGEATFREIRREFANHGVFLLGEYVEYDEDTWSPGARAGAEAAVRFFVDYVGNPDPKWAEQIRRYYGNHHDAPGAQRIRPEEIVEIFARLQDRIPRHFIDNTMWHGLARNVFPLRLNRLKATLALYDYLLSSYATDQLLGLRLSAASYPDVATLNRAVDWDRTLLGNPFEMPAAAAIGEDILSDLEDLARSGRGPRVADARRILSRYYPDLESQFRAEFAVGVMNIRRADSLPRVRD